MKSKQVAVWSEITANDAAIIRETLRVKQSVAQTTKLPSDITMVGLFGASRVELTDGSGMGFALLHFVDTKNNQVCIHGLSGGIAGPLHFVHEHFERHGL